MTQNIPIKQITIIDTFGFFFRSFYALPALKTKANFPTGLLTGFANLINFLYMDKENSYIIFALEGGGTNRRKLIAPAYKQNRQAPPEELSKQLPIAIQWIEKMGFLNISVEGYEADDVIASINTIANAQNIKVRIISHDKDLYQLIDKDTFIFDPIKKQNIDAQGCIDKFGVSPAQFIDYQSLVGDSADNVTGIKGIGAKTAAKLIEHFGSLDDIFQKSDELQNVLTPRLSEMIKQGESNAYISKSLVTLEKNLPLNIDFEACKIGETNPLLSIIDELKAYELNAILKKLNTSENFKDSGDFKDSTDSTDSTITQDFKTSRNFKIQDSLFEQNGSAFSYTPVLIRSKDEVLKILSNVAKDRILAFDVESDGLDTKTAKIIGFSFCFDGIKGYYVPINHRYLGAVNSLDYNESKEVLEEIFSYSLLGHNIKFDLQIIEQNFNITPKSTIADSMILAWLKDSQSLVGLDKLMLKYFNHKMISFDEVVDKNKNFSDVLIDTATKYASEDAVACFALYDKLKQSVNADILSIATNLEFKFIEVLAEMESKGIKIDCDFFAQLQKQYIQFLNAKSEEIYQDVEERFNLNSPKQLSNILFNKLNLQVKRHLKSGFSTDENTLKLLQHEHVVIPKILEYREYNKLLNTYVEPLLKYALLDNQHRVYTSFLQSGTATGRLSSRAPNLQNIPIRSEEGRKIRQGFIAKDGFKLISVDYSQIELRLLAHFSQDPFLVDAFMRGQDIHLQTAIAIFGEQDASSKRNIAKSINFGLIYGMGFKRLAETLNISSALAKQYIDSYFLQFPTIREYLATQKILLEQNGFVNTLLGRKRYFDFSTSTPMWRATFLREGINTIFQGSAADLIKLSMLKLHNKFKNSDLHMLLQVHDELIFEAPAHKCESYALEIRSIMNNIYKLNVPLESNYAIGDNWAELK